MWKPVGMDSLPYCHVCGEMCLGLGSPPLYALAVGFELPEVQNRNSNCPPVAADMFPCEKWCQRMRMVIEDVLRVVTVIGNSTSRSKMKA
jgi:hypothetical protein